MIRVLHLLSVLSILAISPSVGQGKRASQPTPFILGIVDSIQSVSLHEKRVLNIYLPDGYSPDSATRYPVIYLPDGGADEDFVHIVGLVSYFTTPWVARFPPSIVVGLANVNRRRDFTFAVPNLDFLARVGFAKKLFPAYGGSGAYIDFIEKEVQPFIEKRYKTTASKTIIGESMAGLLVTEILLKKPALFDNYVIIAPSLWWGQESLLTDGPGLLKANTTKKVSVYVSACNRAEDVIMYKDAKALADMLTTYGGPTTRVFFDYLPNETHATVSHQSVYNAFKALYLGKK
ncbi:alpha/beta hydrolase [uncultured Fibrella sp.]|uniref:alpha/beta hydrolase n=1 Tax=uncultured Fibrella sp. TaxID=1284596 RepID=UPI0035C969B2